MFSFLLTIFLIRGIYDIIHVVLGLFNIMTSEKPSFISPVILANRTHVITHNSNLYRDYNNHITHLLLCIYKSMPYLLNTSTD